MSESAHPLAPEHLPFFAPAADGSDAMLVNVAIFLLLALFGGLAGILWLHTLPERMAHRSQKLQFELVAVLGLLALFTHIHAFWVAGLLLALIDLPDISTPVRSIASSLERIAGGPAPEASGDEARASGSSASAAGAPAASASAVPQQEA